MCLFRAVNQLASNVFGFLALPRLLLEEVREEEHLQYGENDEQLDENDGPQRASQRHVPESVVIEVEDPVKKPVLSHRRMAFRGYKDSDYLRNSQGKS